MQHIVTSTKLYATDVNTIVENCSRCNHFDICRPTSIKDKVFTDLLGFIRKQCQNLGNLFYPCTINSFKDLCIENYLSLNLPQQDQMIFLQRSSVETHLYRWFFGLIFFWTSNILVQPRNLLVWSNNPTQNIIKFVVDASSNVLCTIERHNALCRFLFSCPYSLGLISSWLNLRFKGLF